MSSNTGERYWISMDNPYLTLINEDIMSYPRVVPDIARKLAGDWHGGQTCPLYSISSTGTIYRKDIGHDAIAVVGRLIRETMPNGKVTAEGIAKLGRWERRRCILLAILRRKLILTMKGKVDERHQ